MTMGAMVGWLSVFLGADLWTGLLIAAGAGALLGLLHAVLTVPLGPVRSMYRGWASRSLPRRWPTTSIA